jgi:8-oxo-dGTP pyrophosphatase MutT (NUDIX family)
MVRIDVALILPYDTRGRFLLQHRSDDAAYLPGYWAFFGGKCERGETPEITVRREAKEELELRLGAPVCVLVRRFRTPRAHGLINVFVQRISARTRLRQHEGKAKGWFLPAETKRLLMVKRDRMILAHCARAIAASAARKGK